MKKKYLFVIFILILCAGCRAEYNLEINEDLTVKETVLATENPEFFAQYPKSSMGRVVGFILEPYLDTLNENKYLTNTYITDNRSGASISREYANLEQYSKETILTSEYTDNLVYSKDGNKITLIAKGNFSKAEQDQERFVVNDATISITLPFKVIETNADVVGDKVYTWKFSEDDIEEREIKIVFDSTKKEKRNNNSYQSIIILIGLFILLIVGFIVYNKIRKKNEDVNEI